MKMQCICLIIVLLLLTKHSSSINLLEPTASRKYITATAATPSPCMLSKLLLSKYKYEDKKNISKALDLNDKGIFSINVNFNCGENNKTKYENSVSPGTKSTIMRKKNDANIFEGGYKLLSGSPYQDIDDVKPKALDTETKILGVLKDISNKIDKSMKTLNLDKHNAYVTYDYGSIFGNNIQENNYDEKDSASAEYEIEIIPKKKPKKRFNVVNKKRSGKGDFNQQHKRGWQELLHKMKMPNRQSNNEGHERIEPIHYWDDKKHLVHKDSNHANKRSNKHLLPNRSKTINRISKVGIIKDQKKNLPAVHRIKLKNVLKKLIDAHIYGKSINSKSRRPTNNIMKIFKILNVLNSHSDKINSKDLSWEFDDPKNLYQQDLSNEDSSNSESIDEDDIPLWLNEDTKTFKREKRSTTLTLKRISMKPVENLKNTTEITIEEITSNKNKSPEDLKQDVGKLLKKVSDEKLVNNITDFLINKMFERLRVRKDRPSHPESKEQIEILLNPQLSDIEDSSEKDEGPDNVRVLGGGKFKLKEGSDGQENSKGGKNRRKIVSPGEPVYI